MPADHAHALYVAMFVDDRFDDHNPGKPGLPGKNRIFRRRPKKQAWRLHFATHADRHFRPCRNRWRRRLYTLQCAAQHSSKNASYLTSRNSSRHATGYATGAPALPGVVTTAFGMNVGEMSCPGVKTLTGAM